MTVYVIMLAGRRMLGWHRDPMPENGFDGGWRPYVWTNRLHEAEQFDFEAAAVLYARSSLKHDNWTVVGVKFAEEGVA